MISPTPSSGRTLPQKVKRICLWLAARATWSEASLPDIKGWDTLEHGRNETMEHSNHSKRSWPFQQPEGPKQMQELLHLQVNSIRRIWQQRSQISHITTSAQRPIHNLPCTSLAFLEVGITYKTHNQIKELSSGGCNLNINHETSIQQFQFQELTFPVKIHPSIINYRGSMMVSAK